MVASIVKVERGGLPVVPIGSGACGVDEPRQRHVLFGHTTRIMGGKDDLDLVVHVRPLRMVIRLVGGQRHASHEAPGLVEVRELEALPDRVPPGDLRPALECAERITARLAGEFGGHLVSSTCGPKLASSYRTSLGSAINRRPA